MALAVNGNSVIGFVGLGSMGLPMAKNLVAKGFTVRGADLRAEAVKELADAGGVAATSPADAALKADVLVLMVVNAEQAETVLFTMGALDAMMKDGTVILMATCAPGAVEALAKRVEATGRTFVDAPVSGGVVGAKAGTLTIMCSAPNAVFNHAKPVLDIFGDKLFHVGEKPGQGAMVKTVNQLLCGVHIAAMAEAFSLAEKAGIDLKTVLEIVSNSAASSWMIRDRGPRMVEEPGLVTSAVDIFVKDLGIVMQAGTSMKAALPIAAAAHQMFLATSGQGKGTLDDSQVIAAYRKVSGK
jgi:putative dehydrogenase